MIYQRFALIYSCLQVPRDIQDNTLSKHISSMCNEINNSIKNNVNRPPLTVDIDESIAQFKGMHCKRVCIK